MPGGYCLFRVRKRKKKEKKNREISNAYRISGHILNRFPIPEIIKQNDLHSVPYKIPLFWYALNLKG